MKQGILLGLLFIGLASCQSRKDFEIQGTVKNQKDGQVFFVNLQSEKQDTVEIKDGKFNLTGIANEPTPFLMFAPDVLPSQAIFFADHGKTTVEFTAQEPSTLKIEGCKSQQEYEEFTKLTKPLLAQFDSIQKLAMSGEIESQEVQKIAMQIQQRYESKNLDFVKKHPSSYVSALLAYEYLRQKAELSAEGKKELINSLDKEIQESHFGKKMIELIQADETTSIGSPAPIFSLPNSDDKNISLESFRGQYVLIDFWASWCEPCRAENPNVVAAYNKFKNKKFTIVGVSLDENKKQWEAAIKKDNLNWTQVSDLKGWNSSVVSLYNIKSIPSNVLIDPTGIIIAKDLRGVDIENKLNNYIK